MAGHRAEGLSAIHTAGVVHRDLKPANVLLAEDGPRLIDFGISRAVEASALTHTGLVVGSPGFMSPEQAEGREVGPPSDVFSLGAVLAFAATGQGPFGSGSTPALVYRVVYCLPQLDLVPAEVRPLIDRCLAKDPARRPTADDLLSGAAQPAPGWLPEPVTRALAAAPPTTTAAAPSETPAPVPPKWARRLAKRGIRPQLRTAESTVCSIGYCERERKWYGWSHRAIFGFRVGSVVKKGHCTADALPIGFKATNILEAKRMAEAFAESVS